MTLDDTCRYCHRTLIEIDHYGERLAGCIECNRWGQETILSNRHSPRFYSLALELCVY